MILKTQDELNDLVDLTELERDAFDAFYTRRLMAYKKVALFDAMAEVFVDLRQKHPVWQTLPVMIDMEARLLTDNPDLAVRLHAALRGS